MKAPGTVLLTAAAAVLVTGLTVSASASGSWLALGHSNDASRTTGIDNHGRGAALRLTTRAGAPPLAVTSDRRVARLNADRLDGMHARALRTQVYVYRIGGDEDAGPDVVKSFPGLPPGHYLASYQMGMHLYSGTGASCWFTTASRDQVAWRSGSAGDYSTVVLTGTAILDARRPVTLTCRSGSAYDTVASGTATDSRATFLRIAPTKVTWATTDPRSALPTSPGR